MDTNRLAASGAGPLGLLLLKKIRQSFGRYPPQIIDHAHAVVHAIPLIQALKLFAREAHTVAAKISIAPVSFPAILNFARGACLGFASIITSATRAFIATAQKGATQSAIHAAGRNECGLTGLWDCPFFCHGLAAKRVVRGLILFLDGW